MVIDLSLPLEEGMPGYPGYPGYQTRQLQSYDSDGKVSHEISMNTHQGTHIDAPAHFIEGGKTVEALSLETLNGPAQVFDLREYQGDEITADVLESVSPTSPEDRVLLLSGDVDARFGEPDFFEEAAVLTADAAEWLRDRGVKLVGNDFLTEGIQTEDRPVHHILLGEEIPIVEYLCNIDSVVTKETVEFQCLPLFLTGLEAAPVRATVTE